MDRPRRFVGKRESRVRGAQQSEHVDWGVGNTQGDGAWDHEAHVHQWVRPWPHSVPRLFCFNDEAVKVRKKKDFIIIATLPPHFGWKCFQHQWKCFDGNAENVKMMFPNSHSFFKMFSQNIFKKTKANIFLLLFSIFIKNGNRKYANQTHSKVSK